MCMFMLLKKICTHLILGVLETSLCGYVSVVVEGMYICKTGHFVNDILCLC